MIRGTLLFLSLLFFQTTTIAQDNETNEDPSVDEHFNNLKWRNIGPFRGGRSVASTGVVKQPGVWYMGSTGDGVYKSPDAEIIWKHIGLDYTRHISDVINYNNKLNSELLFLKGFVEGSIPNVTQGAKERFADLKKDWTTYAQEKNSIINTEMAEFNAMYKALELPAIILKE